MRKRITVAAIAASLLVATLAIPATARGAEVTRGRMSTFAEGVALGYDIGGYALMVRTPNKTIVLVIARGLEAGLTYPSHVHNQACSDGNAGSHYSFRHPVHRGALDGSEIWPGPMTARKNGSVFGLTAVGEAAGPEAVSVVIHAPTGQKIACADLG